MVSPEIISIAEPQHEAVDATELLTRAMQVIEIFTARQSLTEGEKAQLRQLVGTGSMRLGKNTDQATYDSVMEARNAFFQDWLNWGDPAHLLHGSLESYRKERPTLAPIDTFVNTLGAISDHGIDGAKVVRSLPKVIGYSPGSVTRRLANFKELGINGVKVVNSFPKVIGLSPENVRKKIANLKELGIDGVKVVNSFPAAIGLSPERIEKRLTNYKELGIDGVKLINRHPTGIGFSTENVKRKATSLLKFGIDGARVINSFPTAINYAPESVEEKLANLERLGIDSVKAVDSFPIIIGYAPKSVEEKLDNLKELGIDGVKVVNSSPRVISYAVEKVKEKLASFEELGIDGAKVINSFPAAISYASEGVQIKISALIDSGLIKSGSELPLDNKTQISSFFILPIESLLLYLTYVDIGQVDLQRIGYDAKNYVSNELGIKNSAQGKKEYLNKLGEIYIKLGGVAISQAERMPTPENYHLEMAKLAKTCPEEHGPDPRQDCSS